MPPRISPETQTAVALAQHSIATFLFWADRRPEEAVAAIRHIIEEWVDAVDQDELRARLAEMRRLNAADILSNDIPVPPDEAASHAAYLATLRAIQGALNDALGGPAQRALPKGGGA